MQFVIEDLVHAFIDSHVVLQGSSRRLWFTARNTIKSMLTAMTLQTTTMCIYSNIIYGSKPERCGSSVFPSYPNM